MKFIFRNESNNKGFTLVELVGVLIVLSIILLIAVPMIMGPIKDSKDIAYNTVLNNLKIAAISYVSEFSLSYEGETDIKKACITVEMLKQKGFLKGEVLDPRTGDTLDSNIMVQVTTNVLKKTYTYDIVSDGICPTP